MSNIIWRANKLRIITEQDSNRIMGFKVHNKLNQDPSPL